jgi:hypothetical protein
MKESKRCFKMLVISCCVLFSAASLFGQGGTWDFSGTTVTKTVDVPVSGSSWPNGGMTTRQATVLEDTDGDVVFGIWGDHHNDLLHNPDLVDGKLKFFGLQHAYIENGCGIFSAFKKISFEFTPASISSGTLIDFPLIFDIRMEAVTGGTRLTGYWIDANGSASKNVKSSNTLVAGQTYLVEAWIQEDPDGGAPWLYLSLDGHVIDETWTKGYAQLTNGTGALTVPHLSIGARTWGTQAIVRGYTGTIDNVVIEFFAPECGDWGYLPADLNRDCYVNLADIAIMAASWLDCTDPDGDGCIQL